MSYTKEDYNKIINLPHYVSRCRKTMSLGDRAAQFAPFAALTGYDEAVKASEIKSCEQVLVSEDDESEINEKLQILLDKIGEYPEITVTFFKRNENQREGRYITVTEQIKTVDLYKRKIIFQNDFEIPIGKIYKISGNIFSALERL